MIALDPSERPSFDALLHQSRATVFPESFYSPLHDFILSVNDISASNPFTNAPQNAGETTPTTLSTQSKTSTIDEKAAYADRTANSGNDNTVPSPTDSDRRLHRIWSEFDAIEPHLKSESKDLSDTVTKIDFTINHYSLKPVQVFFSSK